MRSVIPVSPLSIRDGPAVVMSDGCDHSVRRVNAGCRVISPDGCHGLDWGHPAPRLGKKDKPFQLTGKHAPALPKKPDPSLL
jgi:hypothetical protein